MSQPDSINANTDARVSPGQITWTSDYLYWGKEDFEDKMQVNANLKQGRGIKTLLHERSLVYYLPYEYCI